MIECAAELDGIVEAEVVGEALQLGPQGPIADDIECGTTDLLTGQAERPQQGGLILDRRQGGDVDQPMRALTWRCARVLLGTWRCAKPNR